MVLSVRGTFALNVQMAPLSVLFKGAALLVTSTAVVALEGFLYRMGAQVATQSITSTAGVAAHGTFERLLPRVQFDVAKQVSLLRE